MSSSIEIKGDENERRAAVLNSTATALVAELQGELGPRREELLARRRQRQSELALGPGPVFQHSQRVSGPESGKSLPHRQIWRIGAWRSQGQQTPR